LPILQKKSSKSESKFFFNYVTSITLIVMIIYGYLWEVFFDPLRDGSLLWVKILPLVLFLPGVFKKNIRVMQWLSLFVWFYICEALVRISSDPQETIFYSVIWLFLSLLLTFTTWIAIRKIRN